MPSWWSRPLLPLTAALAAGIAVAPTWGPLLALSWVYGLCLILLAVLLTASIWARLPYPWAALPLFFLLGLGLATTALTPPLPPQHLRYLPTDQPLSLRGQIADFPLLREDYQEVVLAATAWHGPRGWQAATGLVLVQGLPRDQELNPGEEVVLRVRLRPPPAGSGTRRDLNLARRQIWVRGLVVPPWPLVKIHPQAEAPLTRRQQWQSAGRRLLQERPEPLRAIYQALLLGDQSSLTPAQRQTFSRTGTSHLLAVSGLHLGFISALAWGSLFWLLRRSSWLLLHINALKVALLLALGPLWVFAWFTGFSAATQRAAWMISAGVLILLLDRPRDFLSLVGLAAFIILIQSPLQLFALSFQLSFLSVAGIYFLYPALERPASKLADLWRGPWRWLASLVRRLGQALAVSLAATLATLPLLLLAFQQFPTVGLVANVLLVPLVGLVVLPLGLAGLLTAPVGLGLERLCFGLSDPVLAGGLRVCELLAGLPGVLKLPRPHWLQLGAYYLILGTLITAKTWRWRWGGLGLGILLFLIPWLGAYATKPSLTVWVWGTGKEMALVASLPDRQRIVISAGAPLPPETLRPANKQLLEYLSRQPRQTLDHLIALTVTGANAKTLLALGQDFPIRNFSSGGGRVPLEPFIVFRNLLGDRRVPVRNLAIAPLEQELAGVWLRSRQLRSTPAAKPEGPVFLEMAYQELDLLILPPASRAWWSGLATATFKPPTVIVLPVKHLEQEEGRELAGRLAPAYGIAVGQPEKEADSLPGRTRWYFTRQGAVIIQVDDRGLQIRSETP